MLTRLAVGASAVVLLVGCMSAAPGAEDAVGVDQDADATEADGPSFGGRDPDSDTTGAASPIGDVGAGAAVCLDRATPHLSALETLRSDDEQAGVSAAVQIVEAAHRSVVRCANWLRELADPSEQPPRLAEFARVTTGLEIALTELRQQVAQNGSVDRPMLDRAIGLADRWEREARRVTEPT